MNRQKLILAIALVLLVLSVGWSYLNWPRQKSVEVLKYAPGQPPAQANRVAEKKTVQDDDRVLNLVKLDQEQTVFSGYRRNIFKPLWLSEMASIRQKAAAVRPALPPPPPPLPPPVAPVMPRRELTKFTFMGFLKVGNRQTVFLGKDKDILLVRAGETFGGRFKAVQITDRALTIRVLDSEEEIIVPLVDNRALGSR
jgi:hypothetical protein